jgi:hypothetical protein
VRKVAGKYDGVNIGDVGGEKVISMRVLAFAAGVCVCLVSLRVLIFFSGQKKRPTTTFVGAGLPAIAIWQAISISFDPPPSPASRLLQVYGLN